MLPFTKRPARNDDAPNSRVVDDTDATVAAKRVESFAPSSVEPRVSVRPPADSFNEEDDLTGIMQARSFTGPAVANRILPAAGRPASFPPTSRRPASARPLSSYAPPPASVRPPAPSSARGAYANAEDEDAEDEDGGRTVLRTAPKIVKKTRNAHAMPSSISPAAIIKTTLESARASHRRDSLISGPPTDLLEDSTDDSANDPDPAYGADRGYGDDRGYVAHGHTSPFEAPPTHRPPPNSGMPNSGMSRPMMEGPPSYPPPAGPYSQPPVSSGRLDNMNHTRGMYGAPMAPMAPPPAQPSVPAAPGSMPAHFMTPQAPYSDPPGTSVTAGHRVGGRPAVSWAAALLACGLFVGVVAVAVMQSSDAIADTTASFVDPARTPKKANAAQNAEAPIGPPTPVPVSANGVPTPDPAAPAPPAGLLGASPVQPPPPPPPVAEQPAQQPAVVAPAQPSPAHASPAPPAVTGFAPVAVATPAAPKRSAPVWKAPPPAPKAAKAPAADEDPPKKAESKPAKPGGKKAEPDDETKKALEALQKAQLESASSF